MAAPNIAPDVVSTIVTAMIYRLDGVTLNDIVTAFPQPPERSQVERWMNELAAAGLVDVEMTAKPKRYYARKPALDYVAGHAATKASSAIAGPAEERAEDDSTGQPPVIARTPTDQAPRQASEGMDPPHPMPPPAQSTRPSGELPNQDRGQPTTPDGKKGPAVQRTEGKKPGDSAGPGPADEAEFSALFDDQIFSIVTGIMPRSAALIVLQNAANRALPSGQRRSFYHYGLDRLSRLTLGECVRLGLEPEQYELWRRQYFSASAKPARDSSAPPPIAREPSPDEDAAEVSEDDDLAKKRPAARRPAAPETAGQLIAKVIDAALGSSAAAPDSAPSGSAERRSPAGPAVLPKRSINAGVKMLFEMLGSVVPGGLSPAVRGVLVTATAAIIVAAMPSIGSSPWFMAALALIVAIGAALVAKVGLASGSNPNSEVNSNGDSNPNSNRNSNPNSKRTRYLIVAGCLGLGALVAAVAGYQRVRQRPSVAAVSEYLTAGLAPLPVRVAAIDLTYGQPGKSSCPLTYQAMIETTEPLYRRLDTADYLRAHAPAELAAIDAADALLRGANGARLRAAVGVAAPAGLNPPMASQSNPSNPPSVQDIILVTTQTPPGIAIATSGTLLAWRRDGSWIFTGGEVRLDRLRLAGEPKPTSPTSASSGMTSAKDGPAVFAVDVPAEAARLKSLLAERAAYAAKVQAAAVAVAAELERDRQQRADAFGQLLRPGTLFTGMAVDVSRADSLRVALEITDSPPTSHGVSAVLRNDGGWSDARPFQGEWTLAADDDTCALSLRTRSADRIDGAGPLLEDRGDRSIVLQIRRDGTATVTPGNWQLRRVEPAGAAAVKADLTRPISDALAATKPGLLYRGTATSKLRGTTEPLLLRFIEQGPDGSVLRATIESSTVAGQARPFRGTIVDNTYRAGRNPIRLRSADNDRIAQADPKSLLGIDTTNDSLTPALRVETTQRLVGEDDRFAYRFELTDPTWSPPVTAPDSSSPPPTTSSKSPASAPVTRVVIPNAPPATSAANAAVPAANPSLPAATSTPSADSRDVRPGGGAALADLPALPTVSGAFVLADGRWITLPRNNGRAIQSTAQALSAKLAKLERWEDAMAGKPVDGPMNAFADLTFDGRDAVPMVPAKALVLVCIGPLTVPSAEAQARYPELQTYPVIELAPVKTFPDGVRIVPLVLIAPGYIGFGPQRVRATVEQPAAGVAILRSTAPLATGRYAFSCGSQAYEVTVR